MADAFKIPGIKIQNFISATAQYTNHLRNLGSTAYMPPLRVTFEVECLETVDMEVQQQELNNIIAMFNGRVVLSENNTMLLQMLEPKNGDTLQTLLAKIKEYNVAVANSNYSIGYAKLGDEVPTCTNQGVLLFITQDEPTLEYMAAVVLTYCRVWASAVRATSDSGLSARVEWDAQPILI
jgi:hypothetical protein